MIIPVLLSSVLALILSLGGMFGPVASQAQQVQPPAVPGVAQPRIGSAQPQQKVEAPAAPGVKEPVAAPATGHLWEDVKRYGAKGDGKTDDTQAIQKAIDAAGAPGGVKVVLIPAGTYRTSGQGLHVYVSDLTVKGMGKYISIIHHSGQSPALTVGRGNIQNECLNNRIEGLSFTGQGSHGDGIYLSDWVVRYTIENVCVSDFAAGTGIRTVDHNFSGHISTTDVFRNGVGIFIGDHGQYTDISYSRVFRNKKFGIELLDNNVINIISCQLEKNGQAGGASVYARGVQSLNLIGCYNEQDDNFNAPFLILTKGINTGFCSAVNLIGCRSIGNKKAPNSVVLESAQNVIFTGNTIGSFAEGIFVLRPLKHNSVKNITGHSNELRGPIGNDIFAVK